jgi:hypothetical protein
MYEPGVVLVRDVWKYEAAWLGLLLQGAVVVVKTRRSGRKAGPSRPNSDVTWFVPVYLWGIASVLHVHWSLAGGTFTQCWGRSPWAFAEHAAFSGMMLIGVVSLCFVSEHAARRCGLPARASQATLPIAVVAAILSSAVCWTASLLLFLPI